MSIPNINVVNHKPRAPFAAVVGGCLLIIFVLFVPFAWALGLWVSVPAILGGSATYWHFLVLAFVLWALAVLGNKRVAK